MCFKIVKEILTEFKSGCMYVSAENQNSSELRREWDERT